MGKKQAQPEEEEDEEASSSEEEGSGGEEEEGGDETSGEESSGEEGEEGDDDEEEGEEEEEEEEEEEGDDDEEEGAEESSAESSAEEAAATTGGVDDDESSAEEEEEEEGGKQVAGSAMDDAEETHLKEIRADPYAPPFFFEVTVGDKSIRAVAVPRDRMAFDNAEEVDCVVDCDEFEDMVTLVPPGDLTWAAGAENGAAAGLGAAHNAMTKDHRRLILIGLKKTGTMMIPPYHILKWMRKTHAGLGEDAIRKVEEALADPSNYDECPAGRLKTIGPPPARRPKRGAKNSSDVSEQESSLKRSRNDAGSYSGGGSDDMLTFLAVLGEGMSHAARSMLGERHGGVAAASANGHADD